MSSKLLKTSFLILFIAAAIGCSDSLTDDVDSIDFGDDDSFTSTPPIQISGTYLTYDNTSGVRCKYKESPDGYQSVCFLAAKVGTVEVKPVGLAEGVKLKWNDPNILAGKGIFNRSNCRQDDAGVVQTCDLIMEKGHAEFDFKAAVSESGQTKEENFKMLLPYSMQLTAGSNIDLPYSESESESSLVKGSESGLNFRSVSAFAGHINIQDLCTVGKAIYYADKSGVYSVTDGKIKALVNNYATTPSLSPISKVIGECSHSDSYYHSSTCDIKIACDSNGMYLSENNSDSLFFIDKNLKVTDINTEAILDKPAGKAQFAPIKMVLNSASQMHLLNQEPMGHQAIYKVEAGKLIHVAGGGSESIYAANISPEDFDKLDIKNASLGSVQSLQFDGQDNLTFLGSFYTQFVIKDNKLGIVKTSRSGYKDNFPKEYWMYFRPESILVAEGRTFYMQHNLSSSDKLKRNRLSWDKPYGPYIDASQYPVLENFTGSTRIRFKKYGKDILIYNSSRGILKMSYDPEIKFEFMAGSASSNALGLAETGDEAFKKRFIEENKSGKETIINNLVAMKQLKDGSIIYLQGNLGIIKKIDNAGKASFLAGGGSNALLNSGSAMDLLLDQPNTLAVRPDDTILVKDKERIVSIKGGVFQTIAGLKSNGGVEGEYASEPCTKGSVSAIGADLGIVSGMVVDPNTNDVYLLTGYRPHPWSLVEMCIQKLSKDGKLTTVLVPRNFNNLESAKWQNNTPIYSALALSPENKLMFVESLFDKNRDPSQDRSLLSSRILSIDLTSPVFEVDEALTIKVANTESIKSISFGSKGEILVLNEFSRSLAVYMKDQTEQQKQISLFAGANQKGCSAGSFSGNSNLLNFSTALTDSLSSICRGTPLEMIFSNTCDQADGRVSLHYAQQLGEKGGSKYSILGGANIYRISWPCSADLFAGQ